MYFEILGVVAEQTFTEHVDLFYFCANNFPLICQSLYFTIILSVKEKNLS